MGEQGLCIGWVSMSIRLSSHLSLSHRSTSAACVWFAAEHAGPNVGPTNYQSSWYLLQATTAPRSSANVVTSCWEPKDDSAVHKTCSSRVLKNFVCNFLITLAAPPLDPSLYLALHARRWLRISQSYDVDMSDVDTTLMLFAAATSCSRTDSLIGSDQLAGTMLCGLQLLL